LFKKWIINRIVFRRNNERKHGTPVCSGEALEKLFGEMTGKEPRGKKKNTVPDMAGFLDVVAKGTGFSDLQKNIMRNIVSVIWRSLP